MSLPESTEQFTLEDADGVLVVTFSSAPLNYLNVNSLDQLGKLVPVMADPKYRAVIFQSRPEEVGNFTHFSVEEIYELIVKSPETSRYAADIVRQFKALLDQIAALPKVTIAALNGDTMGGGQELALACDIRIGERGDYRYGQPEVRLGIIPGAGGSQRLARLIGLGKALNMILRGRVVAPEEALDMGIVTELVDDAPARALEIAREIAQLPPIGIAKAKASIYKGFDTNIQAGFEMESLFWMEAMQSDDAKASMIHFLDLPFEKRRDYIENGPYPESTGV
ncbi:enoyl-CoA hydratase/isomerase family protein [Nocardioides sp. NPDC051685]|uniref:enoyl-CoA hydratase/isomerase family protein n=1 Tax=Nocardioides sp. NPDC051685 TaxID=3364334 RepID=UPI003799A8C0